jgi:hypothetical protein
MAIPYIAATFMRIRAEVGPCAFIAYLGRSTVLVQGTPKRHDFRRHGGDVVYEGVWLPDNASPKFAKPSTLANRVQQAERIRTLDEDRKRLPQWGLALVIALPPDQETTLDEAIEITQRIVAQIRGEFRLAAYIAIHEPRLRDETAHSPNRHAHVVFPFREISGTTLSKRKVRDLVARVRTMSKAIRDRNSVKRPVYVAEGVAWPDLSWAVQNRFFLELGLDLRVQPIAAVPQKHWNRLTWISEPETVSATLDQLWHANHAYALGDELTLVTTLMRGRSTLLLQDLKAFLARCIDGPTERRDRLDAILAHPDILECATHGPRDTVDRITTRAIHEKISDAIAAVDRRLSANDQWLRVIRGSTASVTQQVTQKTVLGLMASGDAPNAIHLPTQVVVCGAHLSHTDSRDWTENLPFAVRSTTVAKEMNTEVKEWSAQTLVILPQAERISDIDLAQVIIEADRRGAHLILGVDESHVDGIVDRRLALEIWAKFQSARSGLEDAPGPVNGVPGVERIRHLLQTGFIEEAVGALNKLGLLHFASDPLTPESWSGQAAAREPGRLLAIDDPRRVDAFNRKLQEVLNPADVGGSSVSAAGMPRLAPGSPVVVGRSDYSTLPPILREGMSARVAESDEETQVIRLQVADGVTVTVTGKGLQTLRPAHVLSIREARRLDLKTPLTIHISQKRTAWASLLLAAGRSGSTPVDISPDVARTPEDLCSSIVLSLPSALPTAFTARASEDAQVAAAFDELIKTALSSSQDLQEAEKGQPAVDGLRDQPKLIPPSLPVELRDLVQVDPLVKRGFWWLSRNLSDPKTSEWLTQEFELRSSSGLNTLVQALVPTVEKVGRKPLFDEKEDLPLVLKGLGSFKLTPVEVGAVRQELSLMEAQARWWRAPNFVPVLEGDPDDSQGPSLS